MEWQNGVALPELGVGFPSLLYYVLPMFKYSGFHLYSKKNKKAVRRTCICAESSGTERTNPDQDFQPISSSIRSHSHRVLSWLVDIKSWSGFQNSTSDKLFLVRVPCGGLASISAL